MRREHIKRFTSRTCGKRVTLALAAVRDQIYQKQTDDVSFHLKIKKYIETIWGIHQCLNPGWIYTQSISRRVLVNVRGLSPRTCFHLIISHSEISSSVSNNLSLKSFWYYYTVCVKSQLQKYTRSGLEIKMSQSRIWFEYKSEWEISLVEMWELRHSQGILSCNHIAHIKRDTYTQHRVVGIALMEKGKASCYSSVHGQAFENNNNNVVPCERIVDDTGRICFNCSSRLTYWTNIIFVIY